MLAKALRWGNSLACRIPRNIARDCGIEENTPVEISVKDHEIIIRPIAKEPAYSLEALMAQVTVENMHAEVERDAPVGRELL